MSKKLFFCLKRKVSRSYIKNTLTAEVASL